MTAARIDSGLQTKNIVYMARNSSDNSGCGCLILIIIAIAFGINKCTESDTSTSSSKTPTTTSQSKPSSYYDTHQAVPSIEEELSEEDKQYLGNSLSTGAAPYSAVYGKNYRCPYTQCSGIKVTAPRESDIVVIIKRNNSSGKVIAHGYIKAGGTYQFDIPDGTYQTFFYYGEGWNPNKVMKGGVKGGFVKDEIFSKDNPQEIYSGVLSYVLQLQRDGNFQTKGSNRSECF